MLFFSSQTSPFPNIDESERIASLSKADEAIGLVPGKLQNNFLSIAADFCF